MRLLILLMFIITISNIAYSNEALLPKSMEWFTQWQTYVNQEGIHLAFKEANIILPTREQAVGHIHTLSISDIGSGKVVGSLFVSNNWDRVVGFRKFDTFSPFLVSVSRSTVEKTAIQYLRNIVKNTPNVVMSHHIAESYNHEGRWECKVDYKYNDVVIRRISLWVDYSGSIVELTDYDIEKNLSRNVKNEITPSMGELTVKEIIIKALVKNNINDCEIEDIARNISYDINNKPILFWRAYLVRNENNIEQSTFATYYEEGNIVKLDDWRRIYSNKDKNNAVQKIYSAHPVYANNGEYVVWETNAKWKGLPAWFSSSPNSIAFQDRKTGKSFIYRPLQDYDKLEIRYSLPSLSPDGRWLAMALPNKVIGIFDLIANRAYCFRETYEIDNRVSWDNKSENICFFDKLTNSVVVRKICEEKRTPCDTKEHKINIKGKISAIEFDKMDNNFIASYCRDSNNENDKVWEIVIIDRNNGGVVTPPIASNIPKPFRMHVTHDGSAVLYSLNDRIVLQSIQRNATKDIVFRLRSDNYVCDYKSVDWDVSEDNAFIAFDARSINAGGSMIYIANMTNFNAVALDDSGIDKTFERGCVTGGYSALVDNDYLTYNLLWRLGITAEIKWGADMGRRQLFVDDLGNDNMIKGSVELKIGE